MTCTVARLRWCAGVHDFPRSRGHSLNQFDTHQTSEQYVLEVGRVVHASSDTTVGSRTSSGAERRRAASRRWGIRRRDAHAGSKRASRNSGHSPTILDDVRDARRNAQVVLQDSKVALLVTDEVHARDRDSCRVRRNDAHRFATEVLTRRDQTAWDEAVVKTHAVLIDVA